MPLILLGSAGGWESVRGKLGLNAKTFSSQSSFAGNYVTDDLCRRHDFVSRMSMAMSRSLISTARG